jgi:hypothetical protein
VRRREEAEKTTEGGNGREHASRRAKTVYRYVKRVLRQLILVQIAPHHNKTSMK